MSASSFIVGPTVYIDDLAMFFFMATLLPGLNAWKKERI